MRKNMIRIPPEAALTRVLCGLERELVEATDEEILQAAEDLGMNVKMRGSAAFLGVVYSTPKRIEDIFDLEELREAYVEFVRKQSSLSSKEQNDVDDEA